MQPTQRYSPIKRPREKESISTLHGHPITASLWNQRVMGTSSGRSRVWAISKKLKAIPNCSETRSLCLKSLSTSPKPKDFRIMLSCVLKSRNKSGIPSLKNRQWRTAWPKRKSIVSSNKIRTDWRWWVNAYDCPYLIELLPSTSLQYSWVARKMHSGRLLKKKWRNYRLTQLTPKAQNKIC